MTLRPHYLPPGAFDLRPPVLALLAALLLLLAAGTASAADDEKRLALTRDALRRAQQSLQATQSERDALQQQKAKLEQDKLAADAGAAQAATRQRTLGAERAQLATELATLRTERERLQADLARTAEERTQLQQRLAEAQSRDAETGTQLAAQRRVTAAISALLQRSVQSLAEGEKRNAMLSDAGRQAIAAYRRCEIEGSHSPDGNLLGLGDVRTESVAEQLRREMDAVTSAGAN